MQSESASEAGGSEPTMTAPDCSDAIVYGVQFWSQTIQSGMPSTPPSTLGMTRGLTPLAMPRSLMRARTPSGETSPASSTTPLLSSSTPHWFQGSCMRGQPPPAGALSVPSMPEAVNEPSLSGKVGAAVSVPPLEKPMPPKLSIRDRIEMSPSALPPCASLVGVPSTAMAPMTSTMVLS